jgi:hypothetical protein
MSSRNDAFPKQRKQEGHNLKFLMAAKKIQNQRSVPLEWVQNIRKIVI